jgi:hypothetical protein
MQVLEALRMFIEPHPVLHPEAGDIFTPRKGYKIRFFFDGGATVVGEGPELEVNFNDDHLLILATGASVFRFKRSALLGFELVTESRTQPNRPETRGLRLVSNKPNGG